jgi:hypothetical protein
MNEIDRLHNRQLARLLSHLEKTGQLTVELEKDLKRAYRFAFHDIESLLKRRDMETLDDKKQN